MPSSVVLALTGAVSICTLVPELALAIPVQIEPPSIELGVGLTGIAVQHPMGQSFSANGIAIYTIELLLTNLNMSLDLSQDHYVTVDLFEGIGFNGTHLASTTVNVDQILGSRLGNQSKVDFAFNGVAVLQGQMYSFQIRAATARFGSIWFSGNPYADGEAILQGEPFADPDLYFAVRPVPEPNADLMALMGGLLILVACTGCRVSDVFRRLRSLTGT